MFYQSIKRLIDIIGSICALIIFAPLILTFSLLVKLTSIGPVFYTPLRVGKNGTQFKMLKFRSMYMYQIKGKWVHALKYLETHPKLKKEYQLNSFKLQNDPRITPIGKMIRRYSIDEIPQLFNVLKGDMSLVGPRAYQADELTHQQKVYPETIKHVKTILQIRPGASGPWQVSGRSFINFDQRVAMDAQYVERRSLLYDLGIIVKTPMSMLIGTGAV